MDFILKVQWSGEGMDENLINQLLALPGEELHLKKGDFLLMWQQIQPTLDLLGRYR